MIIHGRGLMRNVPGLFHFATKDPIIRRQPEEEPKDIIDIMWKHCKTVYHYGSAQARNDDLRRESVLLDVTFKQSYMRSGKHIADYLAHLFKVKQVLSGRTPEVALTAIEDNVTGLLTIDAHKTKDGTRQDLLIITDN
jgi:hypothetical protein